MMEDKDDLTIEPDNELQPLTTTTKEDENNDA